MLSPSEATRRRPPANGARNKDDDDDGGLTASLRDLSLGTQIASPDPARRSKAGSSPMQSSSRRSSTASSSRPRRLSRSPSRGRDSRNGSPALLRKASANTLQAAHGEDSRPRPTAQLIAHRHFRAELDALHCPEAAVSADTVVLLHDAVYGHRFSRPRTSRSALSTIVERPERIKASMLGLAAAYVRLGSRHGNVLLPTRHAAADALAVASIPFRIHKTDRRLPLVSPAVTNVHGVKWMEELALMCASAETKLAMGGKELQRPGSSRGTNTDPEHAEKLHEGDLYLCAESLEAIEGALGAVCDAVDMVLTSAHRRAFVCVRPPGHHCSASHPSGFCWVNNVHVGIMHAILTHGLTHAAIIDFDLHHGDGSQAIAWQHNSRAAAAPKGAPAWKKTSIGYFSVHDIKSYPCEMGDEEKVKNASLCIDNAHGQTMWNVHLESWKSKDDFWRLYDSKYIALIDKARGYLRQQADRCKASGVAPKGAIFLSAGFDASEWEGMGMQRHQVNVPTDFFARLSRDVVHLAAETGLHVEGRVISVLEGGYSDRALLSGVLSHLGGLVGEEAPSPAAKEPKVSETYHTNGGAGVGNPFEAEWGKTSQTTSASSIHRYDPAWWSSAELDKLEPAPSPPSPPRKPRNATPPTYSTHTQASTAKAVDPDRMRRSLSGMATGRPVERAPSPPPPEVPWPVAALELSKLLIPSGRQTGSCRPEDLNAEASRARRDRQSLLLGIPPAPMTTTTSNAAVDGSGRPTSRMALRERKPRTINPIDEEAAEQRPKSSRRKTVGVTVATADKSMLLPDESVPIKAESDGRVSVSSTPGMATSEEAWKLEGGGADRPSSVLSSRTQSNGKLAVKKTRTTATARKENNVPAANSRTPKKAGGVGAGAKAGKAPAPAASASASAASAASVAAPAQLPSLSTGPAAAVDGITSGMKKIRINLITPSQREAKEKAAAQSATDERAPGKEGLDLRRVETLPKTEGHGDDVEGTGLGLREMPSTMVTTGMTQSVPVEVSMDDAPPLTVSTPAAPGSNPPEDNKTTITSVRDQAPSPDELHGDGNLTPHTAREALQQTTEIPAQDFEAREEPLQSGPLTAPPSPAKTMTTTTTTSPAMSSTPRSAEKQDRLFHYTSGIPFAPPRGAQEET